MARVVVIGGGYGGITVAKGLDAIAEVVLIEQNDQFVHHAGALRAAVDDVWEQAIFMPYSYLLNRGRVVHGTVARVEGNKVHLYGQDPIEGDYIVFATGSTYPFPAKPISTQSGVARHRLADLRVSLGQSKKVVLVGGGTVGLEMAGEIREAFPHVDIQIVEKEDRVLPSPGLTDDFRHLVEDQVNELGIEVTTGSPLAYLPTTAPGQLGYFEVETQAGAKVSGDMWFQCFGSYPITGYLKGTDYSHALNEDGTIRVLPTLQVAGHDYSYAVGDIADLPEANRADAARNQARVVVANIAAQIEGGEPEIAYQPKRDWVVLPLGPNYGASQLLDTQGRTRIVGAEETAEIKGTDLMVSVVRSQLGLP